MDFGECCGGGVEAAEVVEGGEAFDVALHEVGGAVAFVGKCGGCHVPIEVGDASRHEFFKDAYFGEGQDVESDEDVASIGESGGGCPAEVVDGVAGKHSACSDAVGEESAGEAGEECVEDFPEFEEFFFEGGWFLVEVVPKFVGASVDELFAPVSVDDVDLFVGQVVGADFAEAFEVDEEFVGVDEVEVYVVEVVEEHFAPEYELVEVDYAAVVAVVGGFGADFAVFVVEDEELVETGGFGERCEAGGDFGDCPDFGHYEGLTFGFGGQVVAEEDSASFVGEYEAVVGEVVEFVADVG